MTCSRGLLYVEIEIYTEFFTIYTKRLFLMSVFAQICSVIKELQEKGICYEK